MVEEEHETMFNIKNSLIWILSWHRHLVTISVMQIKSPCDITRDRKAVHKKSKERNVDCHASEAGSIPG